MTRLTSPTYRRWTRSMAVAAAAAALVACGSDGNDQVAAPTEPDEVAGDAPIGAIDYAFTGVPARLRAGSTLTLDNLSPVEAHELVAIRLPDDEARSVEELVRLPPDELGAFFPLVETVLIAAPSEASIAVEGDGSLREPGRYMLICVIPTGADPDDYLAAAAAADGEPPQVEGGPPHIVNGMFAELTVVE
ncbi:MAG: hypothetical protein AB8G26_19750 [Ilumatobacter sp.]